MKLILMTKMKTAIEIKYFLLVVYDEMKIITTIILMIMMTHVHEMHMVVLMIIVVIFPVHK